MSAVASIMASVVACLSPSWNLPLTKTCQACQETSSYCPEMPAFSQIDPSSKLLPTIVQPNGDPRLAFIENYNNYALGHTKPETLPPTIGYSSFVPRPIVIDLMREKKDMAINRKFERHNIPPDRITNMEGALHTFVVPVVLAQIVGDYVYRNGLHDIQIFGVDNVSGKRLGRRVLISAMVQQDYEDQYVMARVVSCPITTSTLWGHNKFPRLLHWAEKQNDGLRRDYNTAIHRYLIHHLTHDHKLPSSSEVTNGGQKALPSIVAVVDDLSRQLKEGISADSIRQHMQSKFFQCRNDEAVMSLEMMFNAALHQLRNEFTVIERLVPNQQQEQQGGYIWTFNPPVIFVKYLNSGVCASPRPGTKLISRLMGLAIKCLVHEKVITPQKCRAITFGDFDDSDIVSLIKTALRAHHSTIEVLSNSQLFKPQGQGAGRGLYVPPYGATNAVLVIHNNSDGFGQNVETEAANGSLDGVIGSYSSAAASLLRHRKDLCDFMLEISE